MLKENLVTQGATVGKYRIEARIAEGGMGVFWRALDTKLDRTVGLKTLHTEFAVDSQLRERFINEARALAKLNHPNICVLHDFFESGEQLYIVMEFILGETLADIVRHTGALPRAKVIPIFRQILLALDYAHNHGVIHRDIKPSNIMVSEQGMVKVMDFGIAKMVGAPIQLTRTGRKVGSILYMSPEQIREQPVDHRSDIYSLGVTLYQVCTGRVPFDATSEYEAMKAHLEEAPPLPRSVNPAVTEDLEYVIVRAMSKRPEDRFQSAADMRTALGTAPDPAATSDRVSIASGEKTRVHVRDRSEAPRPGKRGFKRVLLISGLVLASLLALGIARRMLRAGRPAVSTSTATPNGSTVPASGITSVPTPIVQAAPVPDSVAQVAAPIDSAAATLLSPATTSTTGTNSASTSTGSPSEAVPATAIADSTPAPTQVTPVEKAISTTPAKQPRVAQKKPTEPVLREEVKPQVLQKPAKPVVLNRYQLSVVVQPSGSYQVDRTGWGQAGDRLEEGVHRLEAMGPGFPLVTDKLNLKRDTTITVDLDARSAHNAEGDLRVTAKTASGDFPACQVKINGVEAGLLPGLRLPLRSGAYEIELVPPAHLKVDSLQFEGTSFPGARARIKVPPQSRSFARYFLSAPK